MRTVFAASAAPAFLAFAVMALYGTPARTLQLRGLPPLAAGLPPLAAGLPPLAAGLPPLAAGLPPLAAGLPPLAAGLALLALTRPAGSLPLLLAAAAVAGAGQGLVFLGGLTVVNPGVTLIMAQACMS